MSVVVKVPGRVCLLGDKSDLLGRPVIAAAISKFFTFKVSQSKDSKISFSFPQRNHHWERPFNSNVNDPFFKFLSQIAWRLRDRIGPVTCEISGDLPIGSGLSSSAACSIGFISALSNLFDLRMKRGEIAELAYQVEHNDLGIMCGRMDQYSIAYGGVTFIETGEITRVKSLPSISLPIVIGDSDEPRMAKVVLNRTMDLLNNRDPRMHSLFNLLHENVLHGLKALENGNFEEVGARMSLHQGLERAMGASTPKLDRMCDAALAAGALGAKQIGAGGGGCMIALCPPDRLQHVMDAVKAQKGNVWQAEICQSLLGTA